MAFRVVMHHQPTWGDRVDAAVFMPLEDLGAETWELLPGRATTEATIEICAIPFFAYDVNLGDHVTVSEVDLDGSGNQVATFQAVAQDGGHWTFRVDLGKHPNPPLAQELERDLRAQGCRLEWWHPTLAAIDAPDARTAQTVADHLIVLQRRGRLKYETTRSAHPG